MSGTNAENDMGTYGAGANPAIKESDAEWVSLAGAFKNVKLIENKSRLRHNTKSKPVGVVFQRLNEKS